MNPRHDEILDGLRPRMRDARLAHMRHMIAGLAMVPMIGFGAVAVAAGAGNESSSSTTVAADQDEGGAPDLELPEIGEAGADDAQDGIDEEASSDSEGTVESEVLSLGPIGAVEVTDFEGVLELLSTDLAPGWEVISVDATDDGIVIVIKNDDSIKVITITRGVGDEIDVRVDDVAFPTTTTTPPATTIPPTATTTTTTTEKPADPPVIDRFTVVVSGRGSFIVEREGDTLWVGNVTPTAGYEYEVQQETGARVWVRFTDGVRNWYGKALIGEHGEVEQIFWDEEVVFEPIYRWVEIRGIGAVRFKLWSDGLVYVKEWETAEGVVFFDDNAGAPAEVARVGFEGQGVVWIVEAWKNDNGGLSWSTTNTTPE